MCLELTKLKFHFLAASRLERSIDKLNQLTCFCSSSAVIWIGDSDGLTKKPFRSIRRLAGQRLATIFRQARRQTSEGTRVELRVEKRREKREEKREARYFQLGGPPRIRDENANEKLACIIAWPQMPRF